LPHNIKSNPDETNINNFYQGEFRRTLLDVSLLEYAINKDAAIRNSPNKTLVITCLDQIPNEYRFTYQNNLIYCQNEREFVKKIADILNIQQVYLSSSPASEAIYKAISISNE
jgi:hypothetical protein